MTALEYCSSENQIPDAELSVDEGAQQLAYEMTEKGRKTLQLFSMNLPVNFIDTLLKKFPLNSSLLADLVVFNPSERSQRLSLIWQKSYVSFSFVTS